MGAESQTSYRAEEYGEPMCQDKGERLQRSELLRGVDPDKNGQQPKTVPMKPSGKWCRSGNWTFRAS